MTLGGGAGVRKSDSPVFDPKIRNFQKFKTHCSIASPHAVESHLSMVLENKSKSLLRQIEIKSNLEEKPIFSGEEAKK